MLLRWNQPLFSHDPWREVRALQRHMDDVFSGLVDPQRRQTSSAASGPGFNVSERNDAYVVEAALPGVKQEDLTIDATANSLTVKGTRDVQAPEGYTVHRRERANSKFARTFTFHGRLDLEKVHATMKDGLLRVELAKHEQEQPRKIAIGTA